MTDIIYKPAWSEHEKDMRSDNVEVAAKATDAFIEEREKETQVSTKARDWEADRKKEWANNKPEFVKNRLEKEKSAEKDLIRKIKDGGNVNYDLKPARGYLLIRILESQEQTPSGIIIPANDSPQNTAEIIAVGEPIILEKNTVPAGVEVGDVVLLKKHAGMDITVKGESLKICVFSDVLAILEE